MKEVGLGHTSLDDAVRLGSGLSGGTVAREPGERGQGRRGLCWHGGAGVGEQRWCGEARARRCVAGELWRRRQGLGLGHGESKNEGTAELNRSPDVTEKETEKSPENARDPLTGGSDGSNRTLPPNVRSIPERSTSSRIGTGRVRWSMTGHRQGPVSTTWSSFDRPDADLTGRTDAASGHSFTSSSPPVN